MQIGKLAREAGVAIDTVRYYERRGLLVEPERRPSGYRDYGQGDLERLRFIRRAKLLGFSLADIAELLRLSRSTEADRGEIRALASQRLEQVERQLLDLATIRDTLRGLVDDCSGMGPVAGCPIVERVLREAP